MIEQRTFECEILKCEKISLDIYLVTLQAPANTFFKYQAGQYLFINMADNDARPYSIASVPADGRRLQMHIKDIPDNDFTGQVLQKLKNDSHISIRLAAGNCTIDRSNGINPLLFITGGTGFAHSHAIIKSLLAAGDARSILLYWGAKEEQEFYLRQQPEQWAVEFENFSFIPVIHHANEHWSGETGMVHEAVFRTIDQLPDYDIYLSGSSAMVFNIYRQLRDRKVPSAQIYSDMLDILREQESS